MISKREVVLIAAIAFLLGVIACHTMTHEVRPAAAQPLPVAGQKFQQRCEYIHKYVQYPDKHEESINDYLNLKAQSRWKLVGIGMNIEISAGGTDGSAPYFCFVREL
jgi:hypothetical protein